jgi:hypothetical protein
VTGNAVNRMPTGPLKRPPTACLQCTYAVHMHMSPPLLFFFLPVSPTCALRIISMISFCCWALAFSSAFSSSD